jgi:hypothetical protein
MKTTIDTAVGQNSLEASMAREREKERDTPDELWTMAVTQTLVEHLPRLSLPGSSPALRRDDSALGAHSGDDAPVDEILADPTLGKAERAAIDGASGASGAVRELIAEVSDARLGRLRLRVSRAEGGLDIVISVADLSVKALIEAEQAVLMQTLKDAGLRVVSVQIGTPSQAGTGLAGDRGGAERPRAGESVRQLGARRRSYQSSLEEDDADSEGLDFTA